MFVLMVFHFHDNSLMHYVFAITEFGTPNGLCSSITESKHIKAVKHPYQCSNRNKPLGQMLITNQHIDKIAAARAHLRAQGMLNGANPMDSLLSSQATQPDTASDLQATPPTRVDRAPGGSAQPSASHEDNARVDHHEHHDSRPEDNPEANAEIKLAKTYGACLFHPLSLRV